MVTKINSKNILIIGFGKIRRIKASKWISRGYNVYAKDIEFFGVKFINKGINVFDDLSREYFVIEICTPTNQHVP